MRKSIALVASFIGVYLMFVIAMMPASIVTNNITLPKNVQLSRITGTVWQSHLDAIKIDDVVITNIDSSLSFSSLLLLNPSIDLTFGNAISEGPEGYATVSNFSSIPQLGNAKVTVKANTIAEQLTLPIAIAAHSFIDITIDQFIAGKAICQQLKGQINWSEAAITTFDEKVKLGKLSAELSCSDGNAIVTMNENNDLGLSFSATIGQNFTTSGSGYLTPSNKTPEAIKQVLPFLGNPDNKGRYRLNF